jgi:hypothetical protein
LELRAFKLDDYEEVVDMYYNFNNEVYGSYREMGAKYFYYKVVQEWINTNKHIIVSHDKEDKVTGFTLCFVDTFSGLTESIYNCEICYVKPEFRNTRAAYLLYNNGYSKAKDLGLNIYTSGRIENNVDKLMCNHFNLEPKFINMEGTTK